VLKAITGGYVAISCVLRRLIMAEIHLKGLVINCCLAISMAYDCFMDLRKLEIFIKVVEAGSLTAGAKRCRVSQPAASQQIQSLEEEVGESLLVRSRRGVEPTAAGNTVFKHGKALLASSDRLKNLFIQRRKLQSGSISFGVIPTIAPYLLPQWLGPFRAEFPGVAVTVSESQTKHLYRQLAEGDIEFAVLSDVSPKERDQWGLSVKELFKEPLLLAVPSDHTLATRMEDPTIEDIPADELIYLKDGHCLAERTMHLCRIHETNPNLECGQLATALAMVASGLGISVVPQLATKGQVIDGVVTRKFEGGGMYRSINLIKRKGHRESPAAKELLKILTPSS